MRKGTRHTTYFWKIWLFKFLRRVVRSVNRNCTFNPKNFNDMFTIFYQDILDRKLTLKVLCYAQFKLNCNKDRVFFVTPSLELALVFSCFFQAAVNRFESNELTTNSTFESHYSFKVIPCIFQTMEFSWSLITWEVISK